MSYQYRVTHAIQDLGLESKRVSRYLPKDVCLETVLTKEDKSLDSGIALKLPILSAAMDTVTDAKVAIIMAQNGGLAVLPRSKDITPEMQSKMIAAVKRYEAHIVSLPQVVFPSMTIGQVNEMIATYGYSGYPVVANKENYALVGIITKRDTELVRDPSTLVSERMTQDVITAPAGLEREAAREMLDKSRHSRIPVIDSNKQLTGLITSDDILKREMYPDATRDPNGRLMVAVAVGTDIDEDSLRLIKYADAYVVDASIGKHENVPKAIEYLLNHTKKPVIGGNVMDKAGAKLLIDAGVHCLKVGYGIGASCISGDVTGIAKGLAETIEDCVEIADEYHVPVIADGSIKNSSDISIAGALGASAVMCGRIIAEAEEAPIIDMREEFPGFKERLYRGMGSESVRGGRDYKKVPEGVEEWVPIKGPLLRILSGLENGVKNGLSGLGFNSWQEFRKNPDLVINIVPKSSKGVENERLKNIPWNWQK